MLPKGNSHLSDVGVGMFCGIFPSMGQTVFGDLKLSLGGAGLGGGAVDEDASASPIRRPMPPKPASSSDDGWDLDVLASVENK